VGKSGVLEHKCGNISETRKDRGKVSSGTIPVPLRHVSLDWRFATHTQNWNLYYLRNWSNYGPNLADTFTGSMRTNPLKIWEERERGRFQGLPTFLGTPYYLRNMLSYELQILYAHS